MYTFVDRVNIFKVIHVHVSCNYMYIQIHVQLLNGVPKGCKFKMHGHINVNMVRLSLGRLAESSLYEAIHSVDISTH